MDPKILLVCIDPNGKPTVDGDRSGRAQEDIIEHQLTCASSHTELEASLHENGNTVDDVTGDIQLEGVAFCAAATA